MQKITQIAKENIKKNNYEFSKNHINSKTNKNKNKNWNFIINAKLITNQFTKINNKIWRKSHKLQNIKKIEKEIQKQNLTHLMVRSRSPTRYTAWNNLRLSFFGHSSNSALGSTAFAASSAIP